jgi:hypothetical protein
MKTSWHFFLILPEKGEIYLDKIRPVLALRSPPGQPSYFFLNNQGRQLRGSNMSTFFMESFEKCSGKKGVRPNMIRHLITPPSKKKKTPSKDPQSSHLKGAKRSLKFRK